MVVLHHWVIPEKINIPPTEENSAIWVGGGKSSKECPGGILLISSVRESMDLFWNDPFSKIMQEIKSSQKHAKLNH